MPLFMEEGERIGGRAKEALESWNPGSGFLAMVMGTGLR